MTRWPVIYKNRFSFAGEGQRADGYHTLQTLFQFLDYGDTLTIEPRSDGQLRLLTPVAGVPDEENLIVRAARLLMHAASESDRLPAGSGADISIDKRLPMGGGLGGGSSNAATVLVALNHLWGCGLSEDELATLGLQLGAPVPVRRDGAYSNSQESAASTSRKRFLAISSQSLLNSQFNNVLIDRHRGLCVC